MLTHMGKTWGPQSGGAPILLQTSSRGWRPNPRRAGVIFWFREAGLSRPNRNLSRRPAVQTDRPSARRDHVARCLSSHLSIIECTHRADGEDTPARRARWIMRTCVLLMWSEKLQRGCCQILSDDAHEKAMGALSKYRVAAPRRSTQRLASRAHASLPMTCGGYETAIGLGIEVWHAASRSRCERRRTDRDCTFTGPPPRLQ
jgi:hypothetical protein